MSTSLLSSPPRHTMLAFSGPVIAPDMGPDSFIVTSLGDADVARLTSMGNPLLSPCCAPAVTACFGCTGLGVSQCDPDPLPSCACGFAVVLSPAAFTAAALLLLAAPKDPDRGSMVYATALQGRGPGADITCVAAEMCAFTNRRRGQVPESTFAPVSPSSSLQGQDSQQGQPTKHLPCRPAHNHA